MAEVHLLGQLIGGSQFNEKSICCRWRIDYGNSFNFNLSKPINKWTLFVLVGIRRQLESVAGRNGRTDAVGFAADRSHQQLESSAGRPLGHAGSSRLASTARANLPSRFLFEDQSDRLRVRLPAHAPGRPHRPSTRLETLG